jgi:hypothetical protein
LRKPFVKAHKPSFLSKSETKFDINHVPVPVDVWDATEQSWPTLVQLVVDLVIVCVDLTNPNSIEEVKSAEVCSEITLFT